MQTLRLDTPEFATPLPHLQGKISFQHRWSTFISCLDNSDLIQYIEDMNEELTRIDKNAPPPKVPSTPRETFFEIAFRYGSNDVSPFVSYVAYDDDFRPKDDGERFLIVAAPLREHTSLYNPGPIMCSDDLRSTSHTLEEKLVSAIRYVLEEIQRTSPDQSILLLIDQRESENHRGPWMGVFDPSDDVHAIVERLRKSIDLTPRPA